MDALLVLMTILVILKLLEVVILLYVVIHYILKNLDKDISKILRADDIE